MNMSDTQWKDLWRLGPLPAPQNAAGLKPMLLARSRAVFKHVRTQLLWETCLFSAVLLIFYDAFDGAERPLYANVFVVAAGVGILLHSLWGYLRFRPVGQATHLRDALETQLKRLRPYAFYSIVSRGAWTLALALFFGTALTVHSPVFAIGFGVGLGLLVLLQVLWLAHIWKRRITILQEAVTDLSAGGPAQQMD